MEDIKICLQIIYNLVGMTGLKTVDFSIIYGGTIWTKFLVLCELLILDRESQILA